MRVLRYALYLAVLVACVWVYRSQQTNSRERTHVPDGTIGHGTDAHHNTDAHETTPRSKPQPGSIVEIVLRSSPSPEIAGHIAGDEADETYRNLIQTVSGGQAHYDIHLGRAAREFAYQSAKIGEVVPSDAVEFLLHSAGAVDYYARQFYLYTTSDENGALTDAIKRALNSPTPGSGPLYIGVGEAVTEDDELGRKICVLTSRRGYTINTTPRLQTPNSVWRLRGTLPQGYKAPHGSVLYPNARLTSIEVTTTGRQFKLDVPTGQTPGTVTVGIDGTGADGPGKLLQLTFVVGESLPTRFTAHIPLDESDIQSTADAEALVLAQLNRDRADHGLKPLAANAQLAAIARNHSIDMRDNKFFGHQSPSTGLAGDRLRAGGYRAVAHGENVARNDSLSQAQMSLMASVGHRQNILHSEFTEIGIGVAARPSDSGTDWFVTQLFGRPIEQIDSVTALRYIADTINSARQNDNKRPLELDDKLSRVASRFAIVAAGSDELKQLPDKVVRAARGLVRRRVGAAVHIIYELDQLEVPKLAMRNSMEVMGIGVFQSESDPRGRIGIVIVVGR